MTDVLTKSIRQAVRRPEVIEAMCRALEVQLRQTLGGSQAYMARLTRDERSARAEQICEQFTGNNLAELARTHNLSERRVRQILARGRRASRAAAQK
jgi:Mor family transcriptional regulator